MYYRVAIQRGQSPTWQWKSTVLSSLESLFDLLRLYRHFLAPDHLRVFSSYSCEGLDEQLVRENQGLESTSMTAARFLQEERFICSHGLTTAGSTQQTVEYQKTAAVDIATQSPSNASRLQGHTPDAGSMSPLERKRLEVEGGTGGDHDRPYTFALPHAWPEVRVWIRLLRQVAQGEFQLY